ncbi:MAG: lipoprotein [Burkholderiaceae bacterium]|nr:lipoprotein [Burkholderiaceae bacterium]
MKCFANAAVRWPGLARASLIVVIIAMVAGCGQRGPLTLPKPADSSAAPPSGATKGAGQAAPTESARK